MSIIFRIDIAYLEHMIEDPFSEILNHIPLIGWHVNYRTYEYICETVDGVRGMYVR